VSDDNVCLLDEAGFPTCYGAMGLDPVTHDTSELYVPPPPEGESFVQIANSEDHACGRREDGTVLCWGPSWFETDPQLPAPGEVFTYIDGWGADDCGIHPDGTVGCWGYRFLSDRLPFSEQPPVGEFDALTVGEYFACGIVRGGQDILCWGGELFGNHDPPSIAEVLAASGDAP
jgi:hypothetical protein